MILTKEEWLAEAKERFGSNTLFWKFVCPICETVIEARDYKKAGALESAVGFNCIGRYLKDTQKAFINTKIIKGKPCNYTSGGLFNFNPVEVNCDGIIVKVFDFYKAKIDG